MARSRRIWSAVAAIAGLLVVGVTAPASAQVETPPGPAATAPQKPPTWVPARCADGAITGYGPIADPHGRAVMRMSGWIQPCAEGSPTGFVVIRYFTARALRSRVIVPYVSLDSPTAFGILVTSADGPIAHSALVAVCVAFDLDGRVACLKLDPGGPGQPPIIAPTPMDDPRFLVPVDLEELYDTDPTCGTCV